MKEHSDKDVKPLSAEERAEQKFIQGFFDYLGSCGWETNYSKEECAERSKELGWTIWNAANIEHEGNTWKLRYCFWGHGYSEGSGNPYLVFFLGDHDNKINFRLDGIRYFADGSVTWDLGKRMSEALNKEIRQELHPDGYIACMDAPEKVYKRLLVYYMEYIRRFPTYEKTAFKKKLAWHVQDQNSKIKKSSNGKNEIRCRRRQEMVPATPEELVRQGVLQYLIETIKIPLPNLFVEEVLKGWGIKSIRRIDIVVAYEDKKGDYRPLALIECKQKDVSAKAAEKGFEQLLEYNKEMKAPLLYLTSGIETFLIVGEESCASKLKILDDAKASKDVHLKGFLRDI